MVINFAVHTFGTGFDFTVLHHLIAIGQLSKDTAVFLIDENNPASSM
jgi:hypothetical protein